MRRIIKGIVNRTWKPLIENYLRKPRVYNFRGIAIDVPPQVFHPGLFFSTKLLISFLEKQEMRGKQLLEVGSGSGLVSIFAAKQNALVTACDISPEAVRCTQANAEKNNVPLTVFQSDLFDSIPQHQFDIIAVNPPYYKKDPIFIAEHAWYCGGNMEYFHRFFQQVKMYVGTTSDIFMVLSDECDLHGIQAIASENGFSCNLALEKRTAWEKGFIFNFRLGSK